MGSKVVVKVTVMNQLEQKMQEERGHSWVMQAKREAQAYQRELRQKIAAPKLGARYLTTKGSLVCVEAVKEAVVLVRFESGIQQAITWEQFAMWKELNAKTLEQLTPQQYLKVQIQRLQEQKRRVNLKPGFPEDKQLVIKGLDLAIQALYNLKNPNNQW